MNAKEIADVFLEVAALMELKGENTFKTRAYTNAARILDTLQTPFPDFVKDCLAGKVKGIGAQLAQDVERLYQSDHLPLLDELKAYFPAGLLELFEISGLGPKKIKTLYEELQITSLSELEQACLARKVSSLKGFGEKTEKNILSAVERYRTYSSQFLGFKARIEAEELISYLENSRLAEHISIAGSLRRETPVIHDINLIVCSSEPDKLKNCFQQYPNAISTLVEGPTKGSLILKSGIQVDLRIIKHEEEITTRLYFTGSKEHNTALHARAQKFGLTLNEYGLFRDEEPLPLNSEASVYEYLQLAHIPPEARENLGEIEFAAQLFEQKRNFPNLVTQKDIKGILHAHSNYSDGANTLEEMARATRDFGFEYLGISDHSQSAIYASGLKVDDILRQHEEIDRLNEILAPFTIFKGVESDILIDGSLDYPDKILERFDFVVASVHSRFSLSEPEMTARMIRAIENPFTTILGHPTGRLLLQREAYPVDIPLLLEAAAKSGTAIEINSNPRRLDLDWRYLRQARALGIDLPITPDAHSTQGLLGIEHGVRTARKAWLTAQDILTCRSREEIGTFFQAKRR